MTRPLSNSISWQCFQKAMSGLVTRLMILRTWSCTSRTFLWEKGSGCQISHPSHVVVTYLIFALQPSGTYSGTHTTTNDQLSVLPKSPLLYSIWGSLWPCSLCHNSTSCILSVMWWHCRCKQFATVHIALLTWQSSKSHKFAQVWIYPSWC